MQNPGRVVFGGQTRRALRKSRQAIEPPRTKAGMSKFRCSATWPACGNCSDGSTAGFKWLGNFPWELPAVCLRLGGFHAHDFNFVTPEFGVVVFADAVGVSRCGSQEHQGNGALHGHRRRRLGAHRSIASSKRPSRAGGPFCVQGARHALESGTRVNLPSLASCRVVAS